MGSSVCKAISLYVSSVISASLGTTDSLTEHTKSHSRIMSGGAEACLQSTGSSPSRGLHLLAYQPWERQGGITVVR